MNLYCESIASTQRRKTRTVMVGDVAVGSDHPIRVQSMTTSSTRDVDATVDQIMRLADAGCEIARVTVQGIKEAESCEFIRSKLWQKGYRIPLVADIHFYPPAALLVAEFVEKVRINPGNFVDKRASFRVIEYDDASYQLELEKIEEKFLPLLEKCKRLNRVIRIGTNHGSLSDRIMNRFGDTPRGMVESALEFTRVARKHDFHDIIFSMKASNPLVMMQAYRLLAKEMYQLGWDYPLHLGVTEAGEGEDGRIKSAVGIGGLLLDGLGDTIRVSLTEDPWEEIDPCRRLVQFFQKQEGKGCQPFQETGRTVEEIAPIVKKVSKAFAKPENGYLALEKAPAGKDPEPDVIIEGNVWKRKGASLPIYKVDEERKVSPLSVSKEYVLEIDTDSESSWNKLLSLRPEALVLSFKDNFFHQTRRFYTWLKSHSLSYPTLLKWDVDGDRNEMTLEASAQLGALLADGLGDGLFLKGEENYAYDLGFGILQAVRRRSTKTEYISCPGCGRTLFNLQEVSRKIRDATGHLAGVKIAVMGCIVNGPGEMADADFGYVGSKANMIDLYVGKTCVERNIPFDLAVDKLVLLIKEHGMWVEPAPLETAAV